MMLPHSLVRPLVLKLTRLRRFGATSLSLAIALGVMSPAEHAAAQNFPSRSVRIVVPYAPGGATDTLARALGQRLADNWAQPVIVDNKPGGNTVIGAREVAQAPADGHTLLLTAESTLVANPALYASLPYDAIKSFAPITALVSITQVLVTAATFQAKSLAELVALAKQRPGQISYGSFGSGSTGHLNMEMLAGRTGTQFLHVPYRGAAPAMADVMGGQISLLFASVGVAAPHLRAGKLRAIGVGSTQRHRMFPELPTLAESGVAGLPGFEASSWFGLLAPVGTPALIVDRLNDEVRKIFADVSFQERHLAPQGLESMVGSPAAFAAFIRVEQQKWGKVIRDARITVD